MEQQSNIERRSVAFRATADGRKISGYAAVFNSPSEDLGGFTEYITANAFDGVIERSDVFAYLNHNPDRGVLASARRGKGSMTLKVDEKGLYYEFEAPNTALGDEVLEGVKRGDIGGSSFAFIVDRDEWSKDYKTRTITKIKQLLDVSPVYTPAYPDTSVALAERDKRTTLDRYYKELKDKLNR